MDKMTIPKKYNWDKIEVTVRKEGSRWVTTFEGFVGEESTRLRSWERFFDTRESALNYAKILGAQKYTEETQ